MFKYILGKQGTTEEWSFDSLEKAQKYAEWIVDIQISWKEIRFCWADESSVEEFYIIRRRV